MTLTPLPHDIAPATSDAETFAIDRAQSSIRFDVRFCRFYTVAGEFGDISGTIHQVPGPAPSSAEVRIKTVSLRTSNSLRDRHLRSSHYFDCAHFPFIDFRGTTIRNRDGSPITVAGSLTIRDVSRDIEVTLTRVGARPAASERHPRIRFRGSCVIDRTDFGVRGGGILRLADGLIGRTVRCEFDIEAGRVR